MPQWRLEGPGALLLSFTAVLLNSGVLAVVDFVLISRPCSGRCAGAGCCLLLTVSDLLVLPSCGRSMHIGLLPVDRTVFS